MPSFPIIASLSPFPVISEAQSFPSGPFTRGTSVPWLCYGLAISCTMRNVGTGGVTR